MSERPGIIASALWGLLVSLLVWEPVTLVAYRNDAPWWVGVCAFATPLVVYGVLRA